MTGKNQGSNEPGSVAGTIAAYATSKAYRYTLRILTGFVRPLLLAPELFGLWNLFALVLQWVEYYLHLGAVNAARFRLPHLWGRGATEEAERVKGAVRSGSLVPHILGAVVALGLALFGPWEIHVRVGLGVLAVLILLIWYHRWLVLLLQARQNFRPVTRVNYIMATLSFALGTLLIWLYGIYGVFWTALVNEIVVLAYLRHHCRERTEKGFDWPVFRDLVKIGFPIMTFDMASNLVRSADRFLIAGLLGTEELGYYALAAFVFASLLEIPGAAREVLEPKMMHDMSEMEPADVLRDFLFRPLCNTAHYILFLIGPAVFLLPFIELVLPRYAAGVLPAQILALGGYFLAISFVVRGVVVANDWQRRALVPIFAVGLFNVALNGAAIKLGYGIAGVAAASSLAYAVLLVWLLALVKSRHPCRTLSWMPVLSGLVLPFLFLLILLGGLWQLGEAIDVNPWAEAVLLAVLAPVLTSLYIRVAAARNPYVDAPDYGRLLRRLRRRR